MNKIMRTPDPMRPPNTKAASRSAFPFHHSYFTIHTSRRASSLITALLVLVVLSTIVVAFMQSMSIERSVARSVKNQLQAQIAADAGANEAEDVLLRLFTEFPDSVTVWETISSTACTVAYFKSHLTNVGTSSGRPSRGLDPDKLVHFRPLISGVVTNSSFGNTSKSNAIPVGLDATNSIDINATNSLFGKRLVGTPPGGTAPEIWVPWVDIRDQANNIVARYAFMVEDESFKVNLNTAGADLRGTNAGSDPSHVALAGLFEALKSGGGPYASIDPINLASQTVASREAAPGSGRFFEEGQVNRINSSYPTLRQDLQFLASFDSGALNLSRHGSKRLNLNAAVSNSQDHVRVRDEIERLTSAINYHLPRFGQRFYRTNPTNLNDDQVSTNNPDHAIVYNTKLSANIRDLIDADSQPTVVRTDRSIMLGTNAPSPLRAAGFPIGGVGAGDNDFLAYGKEAVPFLQEYAIRPKTVVMNPSRRNASLPTFADYHINIDHYFEFWNIGTKDITLADLGPNPYLMVYAQPAFDTAGGTDIAEGRDFKIPLADFFDAANNPLVFRAGQATVITTDSTPASSLCSDVSSVFRPKAPNSYLDSNGNPYREFIGQTARVANGSPSSKNGWFRVNIVPRSTSQTDYQTEMLLGNDLSVIESFPALPIPANLSINNDNNNRLNSLTYFFRGGSLRGSSAKLNQVGDPRAAVEQLRIQRYRSGGDEDQTRYYTSGLNNTSVPANSNFGNPINPFTTLANWPDPVNSYTATASGGLAINLDRPLVSIGELGHVYDPARGVNMGAGGVAFSRGGGRTLRIGQSDNNKTNAHGLWSGERTDASYETAAWRLTDIFCIQDETRLPGRVNVNGILRDNGMALRALLHGFQFEALPESDSVVSGRALAETNLVDQLFSRMALPSPETVFWDRGAISEMAMFSQGTELNGANMSNARDRAREEVVRRFIELICTKGDTFRIHCVGQALRQMPDGSVQVLSTATQSRVVRLNPVFEPALNDTFDPLDASQISNRFRTADRYEIHRLH